MKRLMILGAGWEQVPLIKKAKEMGYFVLAINDVENSEGFKYADAYEVVNAKDISKTAELFSKYNMDAITTDNCDYKLYTAGILAEKFSIPGPNFEAISFSNNKKKSRIACQKAGIKQPEFHICNNYEDLLIGVEKVGGYPVIVKPVDNRGNFGINKVDEENELKSAFIEAVINSSSREFIVEKFIEGTMMTVDGFSFAKDKYISLAVSTKKMLGGKKRVAMEIVYPADLSEESIIKSTRINNEVIKALKYDFGYTHSEYIIDDDGEIWLVEATNRGGGVFLSELIVPYLCEVDVLKCLLDLAFGIESYPEIEESNTMKNAAVLSFFKFPPNGKIKSVSGISELKELNGILASDIFVKAGDEIKEITNDANRHGYFVAGSKNKKDLEDLVEKAKNLIKVEFE